MSRKTFLYDFNSNQWQQIQIDPFANVEIERVPICLVVNGNIEFGNPENSLIAPFEIDRDRFFASKSKNLLASCRWWIDSSESRPGSFRIAGNFVQIFGVPETREFQPYRQRLTCNLEVSFDEGKQVRRPSDAERPDIPTEITQIIFEDLFNYAARFFGFRPNVSQFALDHVTENWEILTRFIDRPLDMNLTYLKKFLPKNFNADFPRDSQDNFEKVCELLEIQPSDELHSEYFENPFALIIQKVMEKLGFTSTEAIRTFYNCSSENFFGHDLRIDSTENFPDEMEIEFTRWAINEIGESETAKLLRDSCENWDSAAKDIILMWESVIDTEQLDELKAIFFDGFSAENRNALAAFLIRKKISRESTLFYSRRERSLQDQLGDLEFKLPRDVDELFDISSALKIAMREYVKMTLARKTTLIAVKKEDQYIALVEFHDGRILQARIEKDRPPAGELKDSIILWAKNHGFRISTRDLQ